MTTLTFDGKRYLITGGASGIGLQTAKNLVDAGASVIIIDNNQEKLDNVLKLLPEGNKGYLCDLRFPKSEVERVFQLIEKDNLLIDGMVYCAGISPLMTVVDNDCDLMIDTFAVNVFSFIECAKHMIKESIFSEKGSIVAISSIAASQSSNRQTVYAGSKAALEAAVRCMAKEMMPLRVRVNALALGAVRTEMFEHLERANPGLANRYPLGAIPMYQVSSLILYLLSDGSDHMTGSIIKMDGGHDAWLR